MDKTTKEFQDEHGEWRGRVLGGKPISSKEIADALGRHKDTALKNLQKLADEGYIEMKRAPYGQIIEVRNSKKFRQRVDENADSRQGENTDSDERVDENTLSGVGQNTDSGQGENADSLQRIGENADSRNGENADSNKTLQLDLTEKEKAVTATGPLSADEILDEQNGGQVPTLAPADPIQGFDSKVHGKEFDSIVDFFMVHLGRPRTTLKETDLVKRLLVEGVPSDTIYTVIEEVTERYAKDNGGRYPGSFCYFERPIREKHELNVKAAQLELTTGRAQTAAMRSPGATSEPEWMQRYKRRIGGQHGDSNARDNDAAAAV